MIVECRGKNFDVYTEEEALDLGISTVSNWRNAEIGDWILTNDGKVIEVIGRTKESPSNVKKDYLFIRTGYGERGAHKSNIYASKQPDYDRDKYYFGKDLVKNVRPTTKQRTFVDNLFLQGKINEVGMWDAESVILAYQTVYKDNNPEQALRRGMGILKKKHIKEYVAMNMRDRLIKVGMDDDWVAGKYKDFVDGDVPAATRLNALNRVSDLLGHLTKERKEETFEGVFALSDGDVKKLDLVRKQIAETTYGIENTRDEQEHYSSEEEE